jgi:hypothetical protein
MSNVLQKALGFDTTPVQAFSRPETIFFWWARSPSVVYWAASYFKNGLYAYGDREDQLLDRIARTVKLSARRYEEPDLSKTVKRPRRKSMKETGFRDHAQVVLYDLTQEHGEFAASMKKLSSSFVYRQPESIKTLLADLQAFRSEVNEAYKGSPYGAMRRTSLLMFFVLDSKAAAELKATPAAMAIMEDIFETGRHERIFPIICIKEAADLSAGLVKEAESAIFVGDANQKLAEAFYKKPVTDQDYGAVKIGVAWDTTKPEELRRVAAVKLEKEAWVIERQAAMKQQDRDWNQYLEALEEQRA